MPTAPPRFHFGRKVERQPWANNSAIKRKVTGRALQRERERLFSEQPLCAICGIRQATIRDHIKALAFGGKDERRNTQGLCQGCSDKKSQDERTEGQRISRGDGLAHGRTSRKPAR